MSDGKEFKTKPPEAIAGSNLQPLGWYTSYQDPLAFNNKVDIRALFSEIAEHPDVSDIVIKTDEPVAIKIKNRGLKAVTHRSINNSEALQICQALTNDEAVATRISNGIPISGLASLMDDAKFNAVRGVKGHSNRYRYEITACSAKKTPRGLSVIMRPLPSAPPKYTDIKLPIGFVNNCVVKDGIVIIAGATGEGKTTTLAAVIRYILENDTIIKGNIITHEDPIEMNYESVPSKHSMVIQSGMGQGEHILDFHYANRSAMRRSPDLVLLGELRDSETIEAAVELSLTGHPVFATTHASSITAIFPRLISRFPKEVQGQKGFDLVDTTRMLVAQKLIWTVDNKRMAVRETLRFTETLRNELIKYAEDTSTLYRIINGIMRYEEFGAVNYKSQANKLYNDGIIDEYNYNILTSEQQEITDEAVNSVQSRIQKLALER